MGNSCAPDKKKGEEAAPVTDMDKQAAVEEAEQGGGNAPGEKMTQVINAYQAENERLKKEVEEMKSQQTERQADQEDSDALLQELNTIRALVKEKDMALVQKKIEAALYQRVSSMKDARNAAESLKKDTLQKFGKEGRGKAKSKFVQVSLHKGTRTATGFEPGAIRLSYSETENSAQMTSGRVTAIKTAEMSASKWKGRTFTVESRINNENKDLVFACKDTETRDEWVAMFTAGFKTISDEVTAMSQLFSLKLNFNKEKLGIRVEEKVIEQAEPLSLDEKKEEDIPAPAPATEEDKADTATADDIPAPAEGGDDCDAEKQEGEKPAAEGADEGEKPAAADADAEEPVKAAEAAEDEQKDDNPEPPCTLVVTAISDTDLKEKGLCESMALMKLNGADIDGLPYSKQLSMLTTTEKPFTITFAGPSYLKLGQDNVTAFPAILKQLTAEESNEAQSAFNALIKGSQFEKELSESDDKNATIAALLSNQHKLSNLLNSVTTHSADL